MIRGDASYCFYDNLYLVPPPRAVIQTAYFHQELRTADCRADIFDRKNV